MLSRRLWYQSLLNSLSLGLILCAISSRTKARRASAGGGDRKDSSTPGASASTTMRLGDGIKDEAATTLVRASSTQAWLWKGGAGLAVV